jgi:two-component system, OmpR family, phosphate regulon sensor histidine kinase PhoR
MNIAVRIFIVLTIAAIAASIWVSPWIGVAAFFLASAYFAYVQQRDQRELRELLRDPEAAVIPLPKLVMTLRNRLKEGEQNLRDRDAEIAQRRQITNAVPDGLFLLDSDQRIVWCNQSALVMHSFDAFRDIGKPIGQLIRAPQFLAYLSDTTLPEPTVQVGTRTISFRIEPAVDGSRLLLSRDVTEHEALDRMRRDFVANVSHELRTPLTVVGGYVETLRDIPLAVAEQQKYLNLVSGQTENMRRLVEDLLTLARLENDPTHVERAPVQLDALMRDASADAKALSNGRHLIEGTFEAVTIEGSAYELRSAISNLLSNAVRYTLDGGTISSSLTKNDANEACVSVSDSGVGIAAEHIPRLTERFYRVDRSRSRETGGTGLGLAIVKHVVQRHRGALEVESVVGRGSVFRIRLPANN